MKHLLNDLSSEERNRILEQYDNSLIVETSKFNKLLKSNLGNVRPLVDREGDHLMGQMMSDTHSPYENPMDEFPLPKKSTIDSTSAKENFDDSVQKLVKYMKAYHPENEVYEKLTKVIDDKYNYFEIFNKLD